MEAKIKITKLDRSLAETDLFKLKPGAYLTEDNTLILRHGKTWKLIPFEGIEFMFEFEDKETDGTPLVNKI
jgi:hypothetical protein